MFRRPQLLAVTLTAMVAIPVLGGVPAAEAYDHQFTHRWITYRAIKHLIHMYPGQYDQLDEWAEQIIDGSEAEDDLFLDQDADPSTLRLMRHFYRPTDEAGLSTPVFGTFENSLTWGGVANEQNQWDYQDALDYYLAGDLDNAFFALGHVAHLVQDATVPGHTHLDNHGPPNGDDYEGYCTSMMISDTESNLPLPTAAAEIPAFVTPRQVWRSAANASYWRNMVPGLLSHVDDDRAEGILVQDFPSIKVGLANKWEIPGVGTLGEDFREDEDGYFYFRTSDAVGTLIRKDFDPYNPRQFVYQGSQGRPLVEGLAEDLIPTAIVHSAGLIKMFVDQTADYPLPQDSEELPGSGGCSVSQDSPSSPWFAPLFAVAFLLIRRSRTSC